MRTIKLGEGDRLATFFTLNFGKIKAVAKGSAKPKSRFGGRLEPFNVVNMIAFGKEKAELLRLNSLDVMERFAALGGSLENMARAWACAELVDYLQKDRDENREGFRLLVWAWRALAEERNPEKQDFLLRMFELKYLETAGLKPILDRCASCGGAITARGGGFSSRKGGALCHNCLRFDSAACRVSAGAIMLMSKGLKTPFDKLGRLSAGKGAQEEIGAALSDFIGAHVRRHMKTTRFIKLSEAISR